MTERSLRVAVLSGGPSREHGVSRTSGAAVEAALASVGLDVLPVHIGRDGAWSLPASGETAGVLGTGGAREMGRGESPPLALSRLRDTSHSERACDAVFVALHGAFGEDGTVQGFLETAGVPYTGSGVLASALAMDKERTKEIVVHHNLRTPDWITVKLAAWAQDADAITQSVRDGLGLPVAVKPARDGSSYGVTIVRDETQLASAIGDALNGPDGRALIEACVAGTEVTCAVLGNRGGDLRTLPLVEIVPVDRPYFDYEAKYEGASEEICPARVAEAVAAAVSEQAELVHDLLGCDGLSRSDFIVDEQGVPWFLEVNTVPGMTPQSLSPLAAQAAGMSFGELCAELVDLAIARHRAS